jgi:hypothetical protein
MLDTDEAHPLVEGRQWPVHGKARRLLEGEAAMDRLALTRGAPIRRRPLPRWPVVDESDIVATVVKIKQHVAELAGVGV